MLNVQSVVLISLAVSSVIAINVATIANRPALPACKTSFKDVTDLRIGDINIIGRLGDR